jgi:membrane AbrB-like protein
VPRWGRVASLAVVGGVLAATFRPSVLPLLASNWLSVGLVVGGTLILSLAAGLLISRIAHLDNKTAALGTLPGAASGMLAMSAPLGADPRLVAVMQYTRVVVVVFSAALVSRFGLVPGTAPQQITAQGLQSGAPHGAALVHGAWLTYGLTALVAAVGAWAGMRLRLPAGALMGPLVLGVFLEELGMMHLAWPPGVPQAAFLVLGVYVGLLFDRASIKTAGRLFPGARVRRGTHGRVCGSGMGARLAHEHRRADRIPRHRPGRDRLGGDHGPRERGGRAAGPGGPDAASLRRGARRRASRTVVVVVEASHASVQTLLAAR